MKPVALSATLLAIAALIGVGMVRRVERTRIAEEIAWLQDQVGRARVEAEYCGTLVDEREAALRSLRVRIDSMRAAIDTLETMDARGVPQERYEEYIALFDAYNESAATWDEREDVLRQLETACRTAIRDHNALVDSLRRRVEESAG